MVHRRVVGMSYKPSKKDIENSFGELKKRIYRAADSVMSHYPIDIRVNQCDMLVTPVLDIIITEKRAGDMEPVLKEWRSIAGLPYYVMGSSDFDVTEKMVNPEKTLRRKPWSFYIGKYVVDAK